MSKVILTENLYDGKNVVLACDGDCQKAWGIQARPTDTSGSVYLADGELGKAPKNPRIYEGDKKPQSPNEIHNQWCARGCERCRVIRGQLKDLLQYPLNLPDFGKKVRFSEIAIFVPRGGESAQKD